uniref:MICOS complex subunit MIC60 n=2 Tax=Lygus hesperus TaxID=30085 RepID=A0A0A9W6B1_LYGHE
MYRHIISVPVHVVRKPKYLRNYQFVRQIQTTSNHYKEEGREPPKKPCPKTGSGKGFYYTLGAVVLGTGAVVAYAKYDDDFRKWLRGNVPGSDEFITFVTAEETTHVDYIMRGIENMKKNVLSVVTGTLGSIPGFDSEEPANQKKAEGDTKPKKDHLPPCDEDGKPYDPEKAKQEIRERALREEAKRKAKELSTKNKKDKGSDPHDDRVPADLGALQSEVGKHVEDAIKGYKEAICILKAYTDDVNHIVESSVEKQDPKIWPELREKSQKKEEKVKKAIDAVARNEMRLYHLERYLQNLPGTEEEKKKAGEEVKHSMKTLKTVKDEFTREKNMANVTNTYWTMVHQAREHFQDELQTLFPNFSLSDKSMKLAEAEMDLFILYAFQTILFYQKELTKLDTVGQAKLKVALEKSHIGDPDAIECVIEQEVEKEKRKICSDYQKKLLDLKADCEQKAKDAIKSHNMMHTEIMQDALAQKEKDVMKKMKRQLEEQLVNEKEKYREEMAGLLGRLKGMDELMKKRAGQEKKAVQAQLLWSACEGLVSAITCDRDCSTISVRSIAGEVHAVQMAASEDDELVQAVVNSIPQIAISRGIFGEPALKERFINTARVARRVALLPEGGASLPVMLLSYLQSLLVISPVNPVPCHELNNEPINPASLNTFEILQRSKYWIDRGDWYQVLRYMNLLKGAPKVVAQDFLEEVKNFLETKQAADVLISHASASALAM